MLHLVDIVKKILSGEQVELKFSFITDANYQELFCLTQYLMVSIDKSYLIEAIFMVLKEILVNSNRANAKRVFFARNNLDLNDPIEYEDGILRFKQIVLENWKVFHYLLDESPYYVSLKIQSTTDKLVFEIANNCELLPVERKRISSRIAASDRYNDIISAYKDIADYQESAGLGIVMMILFLKSIGLNKDNLKIESSDGLTVTTLELPKKIIPVEISNSIRDNILEKLQGIPSFPAHLEKIIDMCKQPEADFNKIAFEIEKNPAISADLLKIANSTKYIVSEPVTSVKSALQLVGLSNIINVLYGISGRKIMQELFPQMEKEWEHANKVSYYSILLGKRKSFKDIETLAVAGLLHDIGKIVLLSLEGDLLSDVWQLLHKREMETYQMVEEVAIGISHSELGAHLAMKWNFPSILVSIIRHHQRPHEVEKEYFLYMEIVYLANMLCNYRDKKIEFQFIDQGILHNFGIFSEEDVLTIMDELELDYSNR